MLTTEMNRRRNDKTIDFDEANIYDGGPCFGWSFRLPLVGVLCNHSKGGHGNNRWNKLLYHLTGSANLSDGALGLLRLRFTTDEDPSTTRDELARPPAQVSVEDCLWQLLDARSDSAKKVLSRPNDAFESELRAGRIIIALPPTVVKHKRPHAQIAAKVFAKQVHKTAALTKETIAFNKDFLASNPSLVSRPAPPLSPARVLKLRVTVHYQAAPTAESALRQEYRATFPGEGESIHVGCGDCGR